MLLTIREIARWERLVPFVRISVPVSTPEAMCRAIPGAVHRALVDAIGIPEGDRFQLVTRYPAADGFFDPHYLGIARQDVVAVEITLARGRSDERKRALYRRITDELAAAGIRGQDVFITLTENGPADWSVGDGQAQLLTMAIFPDDRGGHGVSCCTPVARAAQRSDACDQSVPDCLDR
jgi:phenylpyruvate tautomerase PptA (4-oxalocrotonate tautomerase family)